MIDKKQEFLQKQYELACTEERVQFGLYLKSIAFYFGLVSALLGATVAGALQVKVGFQALLLLTGPSLTFIAAHLGETASSRIYLGWLEKITVRAKLEQALGYTQPNNLQNGYWINEPLMATRHLKDRNNAQTSWDFVLRGRNAGYNKSTRQLFIASSFVAIALFFGLIWLACKV